jgi:hypothetical protein
MTDILRVGEKNLFGGWGTYSCALLLVACLIGFYGFYKYGCTNQINVLI